MKTAEKLDKEIYKSIHSTALIQDDTIDHSIEYFMRRQNAYFTLASEFLYKICDTPELVGRERFEPSTPG